LLFFLNPYAYVNSSLCVIKHHALVNGAVELQLHAFVTLAPDGRDGSIACPDHIILGGRPPHWPWSWAAGLESVNEVNISTRESNPKFIIVQTSACSRNRPGLAETCLDIHSIT